MGPLYLVTERFGPGRGAEWDRYVEWSGLRHLTEVVSLDSMLCPPAISEIAPWDWPHIVNEDFMLQYFLDLDYLKRRVGEIGPRNLLCVYRNPDVDPVPAEGPEHFVFEGYDLVDVHGDVSALTNCGGFPNAFRNEELSPHGLLPSRGRAIDVRRALQTQYPNERHAKCHVWAIFRAQRPGAAGSRQDRGRTTPPEG